VGKGTEGKALLLFRRTASRPRIDAHRRDDLDWLGGVTHGYAICTTPRSGSNFLCDVLTSTGVLGRPTEYFSGATRRRRGLADYPDDPEAQLRKIPALGATPNGVYGVKIFEHQFHEIEVTGWADRLPSLSFVSLIRRDILGQAISLVRALQTSRWTVDDAAAGALVYDACRIDAVLTDMLYQRNRLSKFLKRRRASVLNLVYEDIVHAPGQAAAAVAGLLGLSEPPRVDMSRVDVRVQRDELSQAWRERFISDARATHHRQRWRRDLPLS
jgi:LPS sulfotransferase NodH